MPRPHVVLVPGLLCTRDLFRDQIAHLSARAEIMVGDHTGHETMAGIAAAILAAAPPRFSLAGLSMGGYIAMEMATMAPERIQRLALLDTQARPDTPDIVARRLKLNEMARSGRFGAVSRDILLKLFIHPARLSDEPLVQRVIAMADDTGPEVFLRQQAAILSRPDLRADLGAIACPTLVIVGDADALTPPDCGREIVEAVGGARLEIIPHCGHLTTMECPDAVNRLLDEWLDGPQS
jgi:pimeloyl-ACP methyl ester carboxylesterase